MTEDFLHFLWKYQNFNAPLGITSTGQMLRIIHPGFHNHNSGPDFLEARIYLDKQLWVGQIELHVKASDWYRHKHQEDIVYQNAILHVVYDADMPVYLSSGEELPCISLTGYFDEHLYWRFEQLMQNQEGIACSSQFAAVDSIHKSAMLDRVIAERLMQKSEALSTILQETKGDWQESFYRFLAYGMGLKVNSEPMLLLSRLCSSNIWRHFRNQDETMAAFFFGQAGLLSGQDDYAMELGLEYEFLQRKYDLNRLRPEIWKYSRMRPAAFPDFRLAQLIALLRKREFLPAEILEIKEEGELRNLLNFNEERYWQQHYRLGQPSAREHKFAMGDVAYRQIVINVVVPYLFLYAKKKDVPIYQERALQLLQSLKAEQNKVTRIYEKLSMKPVSALESQGLLQWYKFYCTPKKCLNCSVGNQLIKS